MAILEILTKRMADRRSRELKIVSSGMSETSVDEKNPDLLGLFL